MYALPKTFSPRASDRAAQDYALLFLAIPGLRHVAPGCSMLIGRLLQESIERVLEDARLLANESQLIEPTTGSFSSPQNIPSSNPFLEDVARRLYGQSLLSFVRHGDGLYFSFPIHDAREGLAIVAAEVKRLGFLELARISHYDSEIRSCEPHHPHDSDDELAPHCVKVLQAAGLLPG